MLLSHQPSFLSLLKLKDGDDKTVRMAEHRAKVLMNVESIINSVAYSYTIPSAVYKQEKLKNSCFVAASATLTEAIINHLTHLEVSYDVAWIHAKIDLQNKGGLFYRGLEAICKYGSRDLTTREDNHLHHVMPDALNISTQKIDFIHSKYKDLLTERFFKFMLGAFGPFAISVVMTKHLRELPKGSFKVDNGKYLYIPLPKSQSDENSDSEGIHYLIVTGAQVDGKTCFSLRNSYGRKYGNNGTIYFDLNNAPIIFDAQPVTEIYSSVLGNGIECKPTDVLYNGFTEFMHLFSNLF